MRECERGSTGESNPSQDGAHSLTNIAVADD
jgi:hypothetical protein